MNQLDQSIWQGLGILFGAGVPLVVILLIKDWLSNFVAGIQIKLNSNFQYINSFEFDGRKNCRISNIHLVKVEIQDLESDQFITLFNREFLKAKVWRNIERKARNHDD